MRGKRKLIEKQTIVYLRLNKKHAVRYNALGVFYVVFSFYQTKGSVRSGLV